MVIPFLDDQVAVEVGEGHRMEDDEFRTSSRRDNFDVPIGLRVRVAYPDTSDPSRASVDFF